MNTEPFEHFIDENNNINISIYNWGDGVDVRFSIYDYSLDTGIGFSCSINKLKDLADFIYKSIGEKK